MADLHQKGTKFTSPIVFVTTNDMSVPGTVASDAVARRMTHAYKVDSFKYYEAKLVVSPNKLRLKTSGLGVTFEDILSKASLALWDFELPTFFGEPTLKGTAKDAGVAIPECAQNPQEEECALAAEVPWPSGVIPGPGLDTGRPSHVTVLGACSPEEVVFPGVFGDTFLGRRVAFSLQTTLSFKGVKFVRTDDDLVWVDRGSGTFIVRSEGKLFHYPACRLKRMCPEWATFIDNVDCL